MNTIFDITLYQGNNQNLADIKEKVHYLNKLFDSDNSYENMINLNTLNNSNEPQKVDFDLYNILELSKKYHQETNGYFNILLKEVNTLWKKSFESKILPVINSADYNLNINDIEFNKNESIICFKNNIKADLGGIAKGYTIDAVNEYLKINHIKKYLINAGSSSVSFGRFKDNQEYSLSIKNPNGGFIETIKVKDINLSTSGNYTQFLEIENRKYHHIINPFTLYPENYFQSISILCENAILADVYSTFLFNLKYEEHELYLEEKSDLKIIYLTIDNKKLTRGFSYEKK